MKRQWVTYAFRRSAYSENSEGKKDGRNMSLLWSKRIRFSSAFMFGRLMLGRIFELLRHQFSEVALVATNFSTNLVPRVLSLLSRSRERTLGTRLQTLLALTLALTSPCLGLIWEALLFSQPTIALGVFLYKGPEGRLDKAKVPDLGRSSYQKYFKLKRSNKARLAGDCED